MPTRRWTCLRYQPQRGARFLEKVLKSALGNAEDRRAPSMQRPGGGRCPRGRRPDVQAHSPPGPRHGIHDQEADVAHPYAVTVDDRQARLKQARTRASVRNRTPYGSKSQSDRLPHRHHGGLEEPLVRLEAGVQQLLLEDVKLRGSSRRKYKFAGIPKVEIERTRDEVKVILHTARPGIIIGRKGQEVERLQSELQDLVGRRINIKIEEIARPEIQAQLVAEDIAEQLAKRASFRRTHEAGHGNTPWKPAPRGSRSNWPAGWAGPKWPAAKSRSPAPSRCRRLRAKIDYGFTEAKTAQGHIGVQVWVNQGMYHEEPTDGADAQEGQASKKPKRTYKR